MAPPANDRCLILLAKEPLPGQAKTRLAAALGAERAAQLGDAFLRDTLRACRAVRAALWISIGSEPARPYFTALAPEAHLEVQPEGDLGVRLRAAFDAAFGAGFRRAVAIGSDTPQLASERLEAAFDALADGPAVVGPALDGGYYLLGLTAPQPALFEGIPWSTAAVLAQTEQRAEALGLALARLPAMFDVDTAEDLARLSALIAADGDLCPATRELLEP